MELRNFPLIAFTVPNGVFFQKTKGLGRIRGTYEKIIFNFSFSFFRIAVSESEN